MNQEHKITGNIVSGIIIIICGVIVAPLAIGMLMSFTSSFFWYGLILVLCSFMMIYSGVKQIRTTRKEEKYTHRFQETMKSEPITKGEVVINENEKEPSEMNPIVLARWTYTKEEWYSFYLKELQEQKIESILLFILITGLGGWLLTLDKGASWLLALSISGFIGLIIALLKYFLKKDTIKIKNDFAEVTIGLDTILVNGNMVVLRDENKKLFKLELINKENYLYLECSYSWETRNGRTSDEFRVPVPIDKEMQAKEIIHKMKEYHGI
jgi:hypothetical protein